MTTHALTIDVEDWYHVESLRSAIDPKATHQLESRLRIGSERILDLLDRRGLRGTFFVLGQAAQREPGLIREIAAHGHEIASHGWSHELVYRQSPEEFRAETRRSKDLLEDITGAPVIGYRASTFSVTERSLWALEILAEEGFAYDSSIAPLRHDRYGIPGCDLDPHVRSLPDGQSIVEYPVSAMSLLGIKLPVGGGFFRLFPLSWTRSALDTYSRRGESGMIYVHPWEFDPDQPRPAGLAWPNRIRHYTNLSGTLAKLDRLLQSASFGTMSQILESHLEQRRVASAAF